MRKYSLKKDLKRFLYPYQYQEILEIVQPRQMYWMSFLLNTGARINEARNVLYKEIDFERNTIRLSITKVRAKLGEKRPSPREIAISSQLAKFLKKNFNRFKIPTTQSVDASLKALCKRIKLKDPEDFSAHNLRKTFGTWMLALGVDGFKLAQHLGHSPEMLRTHYASPDIFNPSDKDIMREVLGDLPTRLRSI
jgi:integrase